jgi:serine/threonine protein kinase
MVLNDRYLVGEVLGFGGFGITYKAWDKNLNTMVAIKEYYYTGVVTRTPGTQMVVLYAQNRKAEFEHFLERFLDEAKHTAKFLSNKNIVDVYEYFEANNTAYMVMEYLDGETLSVRLKRERLSAEQSIAIILEVCKALKDVHAASIIHRDISPDNIFLCKDGSVRLIDFGAARFSKHEDQQIMRLTQVMKPGFSPPEQYQSISKQGPWTDIYALGATLYYMVTGVKPEESTNRKTQDTLEVPNQLDPEIPEFLSTTIMRAMAVDMHLRFASIEELERTLAQEKKVLSVVKEKKRRRNRRFVGVSAALLLVLAASAYFMVNFNEQRLAETLPDSTIEVWYSLPADPAAAERKNASLSDVITIFNESFPNVTIELVPIAADQYQNRLEDALATGNAPPLFESTGMLPEQLQGVEDLTQAARALSSTEVHFMDDYGDWFPSGRQMPLGFVIPVKYTNIAPRSAEDAAAAQDEAENPANGQAGQAGQAEQPTQPGQSSSPGQPGTSTQPGQQTPAQKEPQSERERFLAGLSAEYVGTSADYTAVTQALPGLYRLESAVADTAGARCVFTNLWSIGSCSQEQLATARRLLQFMYSDNAQDYLHIRYSDGALPINRNDLSLYGEVYNDFAGFFDAAEDFNFETVG